MRFFWLYLIPPLLTPGCALKTVTLSGIVNVIEKGEKREVILVCPGREYLLEGRAAGEMGNLKGASVRVTGRGRKGRVRVEGYRITGIRDGGTPYVGVIRMRGGRLFLLEENIKTELLIVTEDEELEELDGWKVWISGILIGPNTVRAVLSGKLKPPER